MQVDDDDRKSFRDEPGEMTSTLSSSVPATRSGEACDGPEFDGHFRDRLLELLIWRRDVRRFRRDPLDPGVLPRLLEAAALAPSVGLSQPWRFVAVDDPQRRRAVRENFRCCNEAAQSAYCGEKAARYASLKLAGLDDAPLHLAVFADVETEVGSRLGQRTMPETVRYSVVGAIHTMWLVARAEGIGLGWVSILDPARLAADLDVPAAWTFIAYLCIGHPADNSDIPDLERADWERRRELAGALFKR
jgi:5,6-dimethylbenzimidazole synthase